MGPSFRTRRSLPRCAGPRSPDVGFTSSPSSAPAGSMPTTATPWRSRGWRAGEGDEFVQRTVVGGAAGPIVRDGDALIHANFRADRARQLIHALVVPTFDSFGRGAAPADLLVVTMTEYEKGLPVRVAFPPERVHALAEAFSAWGWRQFHVAET